jgi:hypothetical protein
MPVGTQPTVAGLNQALTSYAQQLRNLMQQIASFTVQVQNMGATGLQNIGGAGAGFSAADAALFLQYAGYLSTLAGVYNGTVQQGGTGGTGATQFNFSNALSAVWAGG